MATEPKGPLLAMTMEPEPSLPIATSSRLKVALTILFHSSCAIASTLITKSALNALDAPILLLALQFSVQIFLLTIIGVPMGWIRVWKPSSTWRSILPLALARSTGILAKTFCLAAVDAAFYQVARGLLLPFTILLSLILLRPRPYYPPVSLMGVVLVMLGFASGLSGDVVQHLTGYKGIILGVGSSFTTAVESVVVKRYLSPTKASAAAAAAAADSSGSSNAEKKSASDSASTNDLGVWQMVWMSNILSLCIFIPLLFLTGDIWTFFALLSSHPTVTTYIVPHLPSSAASTLTTLSSSATNASAITATSGSASFLHLAFFTGFIGFLLTIATFLQISVTSPTTHMIVTAARGVAQSGLAVVTLNEAITAGRVTSIGFILGGSAVYGWAMDRWTYQGKKDGGSGGGGGGYTKVATSAA